TLYRALIRTRRPLNEHASFAQGFRENGREVPSMFAFSQIREYAAIFGVLFSLREHRVAEHTITEIPAEIAACVNKCYGSFVTRCFNRQNFHIFGFVAREAALLS